MIEYYNETTKAIKTWDEIKLDNRNTSFPEGPPLSHILTELGYAGVAEIARPTASASTKEIVRDGVEKNSNGTWMQKWKEQDRFSGDNKSANDTAYQKDLDDKAALSVRGTRNELLEENLSCSFHFCIQVPFEFFSTPSLTISLCRKCR